MNILNCDYQFIQRIKHRLLWRPLLVVVCLAMGMCVQMASALTLSVSPNTLPCRATNQVTLAITGLTPGQTVTVEKFLDENANGAIDVGELLIQSFSLTDGQALLIGGQRVWTVPGDEDHAINGQIEAVFYQLAQAEAHQTAARYVYRASTGPSTLATAVFTITQPVYPQKVTGQVTCNGIPVANAFVGLDNDVVSGPLVMTRSDAAGNFSLDCPVGTYALITLKAGYLGLKEARPQVTVAANATVTQNVALVLAGSRTISGRLTDATSGAGIPAVQIYVRGSSPDAPDTLLFTDTNGGFSIPVSTNANQWDLGFTDLGTLFQGYLKPTGDTTADTTSGNATNLSFQWTKATALIYGRLTDSVGQPIPDTELGGESVNRVYNGYGFADPQGNFLMAQKRGRNGAILVLTGGGGDC